MNDDRRENDAPSPLAWVRATAFLGVLVLLVYVQGHPHRFTPTEIHAASFGLGLLILASTANDLLSGRTYWPYNRHSRWFRRSVEPLKYWLLVAFLAGFGGWLALGSLGSLLGWWPFSFQFVS